MSKDSVWVKESVCPNSECTRLAWTGVMCTPSVGRVCVWVSVSNVECVGQGWMCGHVNFAFLIQNIAFYCVCNLYVGAKINEQCVKYSQHLYVHTPIAR